MRRVQRASNMGVIVQARTTSARFPDKISQTLFAGMSVLDTVLFRLSLEPSDFEMPKVYLAVPETGTSPQTVCTADKFGAEYFVCPTHFAEENDVWGRFKHLIATYKLDAVVRITADCPLICTSLIRDCVVLWNTGQWDYVATDGISGVDVEVFDVAGWLERPPLTRDDFEHVTPRYSRYCANRGRGLFLELNPGQVEWSKMSIDTPKDLENVNKFLEEYGLAFSYIELVRYLNDE